MAAGGGGAWKVAYADFVTAMMTFFLVMWITAQNKPAREAIAGYFENPDAASVGGAPPSGDPEHKSSSPDPTKSGSGYGSGKKGITGTESGGKDKHGVSADLLARIGNATSTGTIIVFPENAAVLDDTGTKQLNALMPTLLGKPNKIEIRGHSSKKPLPEDCEFKDCWQLSYARCLATMQFLIDQGIEPDRIRLSQAGTFEPYTTQRGDYWQSLNCRVEVRTFDEQPEETPKPEAEPAPQEEHGGHGHGDSHGAKAHGHEKPHAAKGHGEKKPAKHGH